MNRIKLLLLIFCVVWMSPLTANECNVEGKKTYIVFGNGMLNTKKKALESFTDFRKEIKKIDVVKQNPRAFVFAQAPNYLPPNPIDKNILVSTDVPVAISLPVTVHFVHQWIKQAAYQGYAVLDQLFDLSDGSDEEYAFTIEATRTKQNIIAGHASMYKKELERGNRIILISHSQGSLYANDVYQRLQQLLSDEPYLLSGFTNLSLGTPAPSIRRGEYLNLESDGLINKFRDVLENRAPSMRPLQSNITNTNKFGHSFNSYLFGDNSGYKIKQFISDAARDLPYPSALTGTGIITVSLSWDSQPDVDLHVYEPNGFHVFYGTPNGVSGDLDRDDTDGAGPEHYKVQCDKLEEGIYEIGINYFYGEGATSGRLVVSAGDSTRTKPFSFSSPRGGEGDSSPIKKAEIAVDKNNLGYYTYQIKTF